MEFIERCGQEQEKSVVRSKTGHCISSPLPVACEEGYPYRAIRT